MCRRNVEAEADLHCKTFRKHPVAREPNSAKFADTSRKGASFAHHMSAHRESAAASNARPELCGAGSVGDVFVTLAKMWHRSEGSLAGMVLSRMLWTRESLGQSDQSLLSFSSTLGKGRPCILTTTKSFSKRGIALQSPGRTQYGPTASTEGERITMIYYDILWYTIIYYTYV